MKKLDKPKETEKGYWRWDKKALTQHDWDFNWLGEQKDKCKAVLVYECSREVIQLRDLAKDFSLKKEEWPFENQLPLEFFPEKPSKKIPDEILKIMISWANSIPPLKTVDLKFISDLNEKGFLDKRLTHLQTFQLTNTKEIAAFEIEWNVGAGQIKKQFNEWVDAAANRFQEVQSPNENDKELNDFINSITYKAQKQTRSHQGSCLKKLAAYRLQMALGSWKKAAERSFEVLRKDLYENQAEWIEANKSTPPIINQYAIWP